MYKDFAVTGNSSIYATASNHTAATAAPLIMAVPFGRTDSARPVPLLSSAQCRRLAQIATTVHFAKGARLYEEGESSEFIYNILAGEVKTFSLLSSGHYRIVAFLRAGDLAGLAENGTYTSTAQAITPVAANRMPLQSLERLLRSDPDLLYAFLCKLCHELRAAQLHTMLLARRDADGKIAMFLRERGTEFAAALSSTFMPMTRSDVAAYLSLSLEAVSRSLRHLQRRGVIRFTDRHRIEIIDHPRLEAIVSGI
jgi:CRP/FNR family transcriptional regulator